MLKEEQQYIERLCRYSIASANPPLRQFYGSLILQNGGRIILKEPKNINTFIKSASDFQEIVE